MPSGTLARYWHTVRHLRPVQVYGRLWFRFSTPRPDLRPAPAARAAQAKWTRCNRKASMTGPTTLRLLGVERTLSTPGDWNRPEWTKLWIYNAHYFDDLAAADAEARLSWHEALIARWIAENPPGQGNGWEPYPTSLRIVNWIKHALAGHPLDESARHSLAVQARWLRRRLEVHLLGNHLWANAKALAFAGAYLDGPEAGEWLQHGLTLLRRELDEQILADGGHFERSPMYHALILEDVLDLMQLAGVFPGAVVDIDVARWRESSARMLHWLRVMTHPDGGIAFFNDAAMGVAPPLADLEDYAGRLGVADRRETLGALEPLPQSGYVRLQAGPAVLIVDVALVGPDYLPGHAHADTLSFELSLDGKRVLVNGGTSTYEADAERLREPGTAMHNTVVVDGADSSEVWSSFRVARRARTFGVRYGRGDDGSVWAEAAHDGFRRLPGNVIHRRRWELRPQRLTVLDTLEGRFGEACAAFRFAPGYMLATIGDGAGSVAGSTLAIRWSARGQSQATVEPGAWHPRFGASEPADVLKLAFGGPRLETEFRWD